MFLVSVTHPKREAIVWTCVKDHIIDEEEDNKDIGLHGFDYTLFEEQEGGVTREVLDGYPYLKHLIELWRGDWAKQIEKMDEAVSMKNRFTMDVGVKRLVRPFKKKELWNCIVCVLSAFIYVKKGKILGLKYQNILVGWHVLNYEEMFMETPIFIMCVVITIFIFNSMLAVDLFYLTQLR